jgi:Domain of unknown function (DUF4293)
MIQRIQTLWLFLIGVVAFVTYTLTLYTAVLPNNTTQPYDVANHLLLAAYIIAVGLLALVCIFLFKNRKLQFKLTIFGMIFSIGFLFLEYYMVEQFKAQLHVQTGRYQVGALLPIVIVFLYFFASRGIYRDERLIKSMDRLR